jgi:hypothetical protein
LQAGADFDIAPLIPPDIRAQIEAAADKAATTYLSPIKALLPESISYEQIRLVMGVRQRSAVA